MEKTSSGRLAAVALLVLLPAAMRAQDAWEHAREVNLERARNLPNFVADETAKRSEGRAGSPKMRDLDTVESEITFRGDRAKRQNIRINGKPWKGSGWLPGINWGIPFGAELKPLFDPECHNTITFEGTEEIRGRQARAYRLLVPPEGCFGAFVEGGKKTYNPPRTGRAVIEDAGGNLMQSEVSASGFPKGWRLAENTQSVYWDYVRVGDDSYWLPVAANHVYIFSSGGIAHVAVKYANYRHFEASTNVTFR